MPIYEYRCTSCKAELEKLQKISDPPLVECPECGKDTLIKLISASSFRLKGSGWYETDFKTGNKKNGAAEDNTGKSEKDSGGASVPADKADTKTTDNKAAPESSTKKETSSNTSNGGAKSETKGETKSSGEARLSAGSNTSQTKSS